MLSSSYTRRRDVKKENRFFFLRSWTTFAWDTRENRLVACLPTRGLTPAEWRLEEDLENYWQWKLSGNVKRLKLKDEIVPHLFECQKKNSAPPTCTESSAQNWFKQLSQGLMNLPRLLKASIQLL
ncbi:unnamed protein product, partial [Larinioides sclopetarius]